jgi:hypothetical protein
VSGRVFRVRYADLTSQHLREDELPGLEGRSVVACAVDEFRRGATLARLAAALEVPLASLFEA